MHHNLSLLQITSRHIWKKKFILFGEKLGATHKQNTLYATVLCLSLQVRNQLFAFDLYLLAFVICSSGL